MLMFASVSRLPYVRGHTPAILLVFLAVLFIAPVYERVVNGRVHRVSAWGSAAMFLQLPLRRAIGATIWCHTFAAWLIRCATALDTGQINGAATGLAVSEWEMEGKTLARPLQRR